MYRLLTSKRFDSFQSDDSVWDTPIIKVAAINLINDEPYGLILDSDTIIYDDKHKREIGFEEFLHSDITDAVAITTTDRIGLSLLYCEVVVISKWRKNRK